MSEKDWGTFVVTGRVEDYLRYRNAQDKCEEMQNPQMQKEADNKQTGAKNRESDRGDGDGAVGSTYR